jgi:hypothetical protein
MKFVRPQRVGISTSDDALSHHRVIGIDRCCRITLMAEKQMTLAQVA